MTDPNESTHPPPPSLDEFQLQTSLMTTCTLLWKELSDHFTSLENSLLTKSATLKSKLETLNTETLNSLQTLQTRENSISKSLSLALSSLDQTLTTSLTTTTTNIGSSQHNSLKTFCLRMSSKQFFSFITSRKKELDTFRSHLPEALSACVDPPRFVLDAISDFFPRGDGCDLGWACVLLLESLVPVMYDPVLGKERILVSPKIRKEAVEIAEVWKKGLEEKGGAENVKVSTPDVHTFLQHLVTFGIGVEEDKGLYRKLVVASAWRKQMPKLAVSLGLTDNMPDMIEELIGRGQQVDAVHFTYEVGLADKFPPVPLLKAFLKDAKKAATSILEDPNNSGRAAHMAAKKEQSAIRAVLKCIEEYKLDSEFPPESLKKRLEQLDKVKIEKKRQPPSSPTAKRTRASNGGPMPPAKAGRSTNAYVSSFPSPPTYVRSPPSHTQYPSPVQGYPSPPIYGQVNRSPPYAYSPESAQPAIVSYPVSPMNFTAYGGYNHGMGHAYQTAYY